MEKLNGISRISALLLVFVLVWFAGCGTTPQTGLPDKADSGQSGGGSGTEDGRAAQLAADLGKAVSGGTVTLSGWVGLKTTLTVPEGVTLDLTADDAALELQDGAVLTVNGTVNATGHGNHGSGWVEGSLRIGDGTVVIAGSGTIYLKSKGRLLNIGSDKARRQITLDGVMLVGLPDNDNPLIGIGENGGLVMKSGAIMGNTRNSNDWASGGGVEVGNKGTFTMEGGEISGNTAAGNKWSEGGGVRIGEGSVFTMKGGVISGNTAKEGGGVRVNKGTFTMEGGTISGNSTQDEVGSRGGGVSVSGEDGIFTMSGGAISGNSAGASAGGFGGGVAVGDSTFIMKGGTISGNTTTGDGGGVRVLSNGTFTMEGGVISGNTATAGGGVGARESTFTMKGGRIQGNEDSDGFTKNTVKNTGYGSASASLFLYLGSTAKWGTGGTYTKGGVSQTGGSDIIGNGGSSTNDTLIATPGR